MKLVVTQNYTALRYLAPLYQAWYERWPNATMLYRPSAEHGAELPLLVVDVQLYPGITSEDRAFMDSLQARHLFSHWFHDPF
jgi:hypothetical protein